MVVGKRVVAAEDVELHAAGHGRLATLDGAGLPSWVWADSLARRGCEEALAAFEVADELDGAVAVAADAQADVDVAFRGDCGLDAGDLDAGREDALEIHHDGGPAKSSCAAKRR